MAKQLVADAGLTANRIAPAYWTPRDGVYAWCFGSDQPGYFATIADGEGVKVTQSLDMGVSETPPITLARAHFHVRCPAVFTGWEWVLQVTDTASSYAQTVTLKEGEEYDLQIEIPATDTSVSVAYEAALFFQAKAGTTETEAETEIPAVYLDWVEQLETPVAFHASFLPNDGETEIPFDGFHFSIAVSDLSDSPSIYDEADIRVIIDGAVAWDGAAFLAPFDGAGSSVTQTAYTTLFIFDTSATGFTSQQAVDVTISIVSGAGHVGFTETVTWTTQDQTIPTVVSAAPRDLWTVRVVLDEDARRTDPADTTHAIAPGAWTLVAREAPYYVPAVLSVEAESARVFLVRFAEELSPGIAYAITSSTIQDTHGNAMDGASYGEFTALEPEAPDGRAFDLYQMLTAQNRREDNGDLLRLIACLQQLGTLLLASIDRWTDILDLDRADEQWLDLQLAALGNPFVFELDAAQKRRLLRALNRLYAEKGTDRGIVNAIAFFLGLTVQVIRAVDDGFSLGDCMLGEDTVLGLHTAFLTYSFAVSAPGILTTAQRTKIGDIVEYMKPAWTHYIALVEPGAPGEDPDHWALGLSQLGVETLLH